MILRFKNGRLFYNSRYLHGSIEAIGARYGMGVCPSCSKGLTAGEISARFAAAEAAGVLEVDFWSAIPLIFCFWLTFPSLFG